MDWAVLPIIALALLTDAAVRGTAYRLGQTQRDPWHLDDARIGVVASLHGLGAFLFGHVAGLLLEQLGARRGGTLGSAAVSATVMGTASTPHLVLFAAA
ncbi:MAG: hypothetical protein NZL87_04500 [Thermomicrobium sp.]|nr:hypothetical protein [Thermomicrobium sp.]MDW7981432.1 hypothetical protein [Thermomicrobium sp.]